MNRPRALLVDLDDTLLDCASSVEPSWKEAVKLAEGRIDGHTPRDLYFAIVESRRWFWSDVDRHRQGRLALQDTRFRIVSHALESLETSDADLARTVAEDYHERRDAAVEMTPGTRETLDLLKAQGMPMALLTNGHPVLQRPKIERFELEPYFDPILVEGEMGYGKPDERAFRRALEALGVAPEDAWMIGDNFSWEVETPQRLGLGTVWVDVYGTGVPEGRGVTPDRTIRYFREVPGLLDEVS